MLNLPNHMTLGPADDYDANGTDWDADRIPRWTDLQWTKGDLLDTIDVYDKTYIMTAECNGIIYEGTGWYSCDELVEVTDIEIKK